jgi:hypothetical protein
VGVAARVTPPQPPVPTVKRHTTHQIGAAARTGARPDHRNRSRSHAGKHRTTVPRTAVDTGNGSGRVFPPPRGALQCFSRPYAPTAAPARVRPLADHGRQPLGTYSARSPVDGRTTPNTAGLDKDRPLTASLLVRGPIWLVWRVKDSNLGRHQPTDLQNSARDALTSNYSPSTPVRGPNRAQPSSPVAATERADSDVTKVRSRGPALLNIHRHAGAVIVTVAARMCLP